MVQLILSTDKLQSGFRAKYNATANEIWIDAEDNGDGTITITKFDTSTITLDLTSSFFTKTEIADLLAAIVLPSKVEIGLTPGQLNNSGGTIVVNDVSLSSTDGTITIEYDAALISRLGNNPDVTIWADNQKQDAPTVRQDDQENPTLLYINTGLAPTTDIIIYLS